MAWWPSPLTGTGCLAHSFVYIVACKMTLSGNYSEAFPMAGPCWALKQVYTAGSVLCMEQILQAVCVLGSVYSRHCALRGKGSGPWSARRAF